MKKLIALLLSVLCLAAFCSCGNSIKFEHGVTEGDTYTNKSIDLKFTKPSGWTFKTDEEIAKLMNISVDEYMKSSELLDSDKLAQAIEFFAADNSTGNNVNMSIEKVSKSLSMDKYIESFKKQINSQLTSSMTVNFNEGQSEVDLGGNKYTHLSSVVKASGIEMHQHYYLRKVGNYIVAITATGVTVSDGSFFENMFGKAE